MVGVGLGWGGRFVMSEVVATGFQLVGNDDICF